MEKLYLIYSPDLYITRLAAIYLLLNDWKNFIKLVGPEDLAIILNEDNISDILRGTIESGNMENTKYMIYILEQNNLTQQYINQYQSLRQIAATLDYAAYSALIESIDDFEELIKLYNVSKDFQLALNEPVIVRRIADKFKIRGENFPGLQDSYDKKYLTSRCNKYYHTITCAWIAAKDKNWEALRSYYDQIDILPDTILGILADNGISVLIFIQMDKDKYDPQVGSYFVEALIAEGNFCEALDIIHLYRHSSRILSAAAFSGNEQLVTDIIIILLEAEPSMIYNDKLWSNMFRGAAKGNHLDLLYDMINDRVKYSVPANYVININDILQTLATSGNDEALFKMMKDYPDQYSLNDIAQAASYSDNYQLVFKLNEIYPKQINLDLFIGNIFTEGRLRIFEYLYNKYPKFPWDNNVILGGDPVVYFSTFNDIPDIVLYYYNTIFQDLLSVLGLDKSLYTFRLNRIVKA